MVVRISRSRKIIFHKCFQGEHLTYNEHNYYFIDTYVKNIAIY